MCRAFFLTLLGACCAGLADGVRAQRPDTTLAAVEVTDSLPPPLARRAAFSVTLSAAELQQRGQTTVASALQGTPGVQVQDYGGPGGLKTLGFRSLGAEYTAVTQDGVPATDAAFSQVDLGRLSTLGWAQLQLTGGGGQLDPGDLPLAPRALAAGAVVALTSFSPLADTSATTLQLTGGSWGQWGVGLHHRQPLKPGASHLWGVAELGGSHGNYPFTLVNGTQDSRETRTNAQFEAYRLALGVAARTPRGAWHVQAHARRGTGGVPGNVVLYNRVPNNEELLTDDAWLQATGLRHWASGRWHLAGRARYAWQYTQYTDPSFPNRAGRLQRTFVQQQAYQGLTLVHWLKPGLRLAAAADVEWLRLDNQDIATLRPNPQPPQRLALYPALTLLWHPRSAEAERTTVGHDRPGRVQLVATLLGQWVADQTAEQERTQRQDLLPSLAATWAINARRTWRLHALGQRLVRLPTLSELYYVPVRLELNPERSWQTAAGTSYAWRWLVARADVFHLWVRDELLLLPTQNVFIPSVQNIYSTRTYGAEATLEAHLHTGEHHWQGWLRYAWLRAQEATPRENRFFSAERRGDQLPYVPEHAATLRVGWAYRHVQAVYQAAYTGMRYNNRENQDRFSQEAFMKHDVHLTAQWHFRPLSLSARLSVENLWDAQYSWVANYPMPGRGLSAALTLQR